MISDTRINTTTKGYQVNPSVTALTDGGFLVAWNSPGQDGSGRDIYAQRYDVSGNKQGAEFRVNSYTTDSQWNPSVTALTDGGFLVTWNSDGQDGSGWGVYAQRYDASGNTQGAEFRVNSSTTGDQISPSVTALTGGGFVVTWDESDLASIRDRGQENGYDIYAQRYDANGNTQGAEFRVNSYTKFVQDFSSVTALDDGGFVVAWSSEGQDGSGWGVYAQRYDANGNTQGAEFRINSFTKSSQLDPSVTALTDDGFVVTWGSGDQDGSDFSIYAQRYDAGGNTQGAEFRVNSSTTGFQGNPSVTALNDGGFVVTWDSARQLSVSDWDVYGQRYDVSSNPIGAEFRVNSHITDIQWLPSVTALTDGGFVVTWGSRGQDGSDSGIYGKRYDAKGNEVEWVGNINAASKTPTDTPNNNDRLISADSGLALDLDGSAGKAAKLIGAVFGAESVSNASYVATGLYYLDNGTSYEDLAAGAIAFTDAITPEQVTSLLWNNVMGSAPSADDIQPYINMLNSDTSVGELGVLAANSLKNQANIDLVGLSDTGIIFDPLHYQPVG